VGTWSALGLVALRVTRPRESRVVNAVLGASAVNDWAQAGFNWMCTKSNAAQSRASEAEGGAGRVADAEARFGR
jgi:predicted metal-binding membrane protein